MAKLFVCVCVCVCVCVLRILITRYKLLLFYNYYTKIYGGRGLDSPGSRQGKLAGSCECGDEPSGSDATDLVS
jgi:hypothetical protein